MQYLKLALLAFALVTTSTTAVAQTSETLQTNGTLNGRHYSSVTIHYDRRAITLHYDDGFNFTMTFANETLFMNAVAGYRYTARLRTENQN